MRKRILSVEEEKRLIEVSEEHLVSIIKTALHTGMRKGEILSLKWEDVDFETNYIFLKAEKTKSNKPRAKVSSGSIKSSPDFLYGDM